MGRRKVGRTFIRTEELSKLSVADLKAKYPKISLAQIEKAKKEEGAKPAVTKSDKKG